MPVAIDATFNVVYLNSFKANSVAASLLQSRFAIQVQATSSTVFKSNSKSIKARTVEAATEFALKLSRHSSCPLNRSLSSSLVHVCT